jgi:ABC-type Na+ efflux pump permease subunit
MVMLIYMAVLLYGISVMRSVLEEKNSRILEVLLSSASSTELMTGKLLGVGAVGLTQILVWVVMAGLRYTFDGHADGPQRPQGFPGVLAAFASSFFSATCCTARSMRPSERSARPSRKASNSSSLL